MTKLNGIIKRRVRLAKFTPNFILYEKDILDLKHIYDLQLEMLYKNLLYQANENEKLKTLFLIKISQEQKNLWTSKCPGEMKIESKCHHNWILAAIKILNEVNIKLCNHEIKNINKDHRIKGGKIDITDILEEKYIRNSVISRKNKDVIFLEDLLEANSINMLKWKHLCKEKGLNTKGKTPKWFKKIEEKILEDKHKITRKIKKEYIGQVSKSNIHINLFDENEMKEKNKIITWNVEGDFPIFCENKKKSQSKKYKRIGLHLELVNKKINMNNSSFLKKCEGCDRNVSRKNKGNGECLIYIENDISRIIEKRNEENYIKPYETLNNIIVKNNCVKNVLETENRNEIYNKKIEKIDNLIQSEIKFINIIKNSIYEKELYNTNEKSKFFIIIDTLKIKLKLDEKGKKIYSFKIIWLIYEEKDNTIDENSELMLLATYDGNNENEFKIILRSLVLGFLIIENNSKIVLGINKNVQHLILDFINNLSNRKKIDSDYYLELLFIQNYLEDNEIDILEMNDYNYKISKNLRSKAREILKGNNIKIKYNFVVNDEALLTNEFNLYWNQRLITRGYRGWWKKVTNAIWKNEMLNSNRIDDLFMYNFKKEIDWKTTLEFISNRTEFLKRQCGNKNTYKRSYRIKNLLKEQPTYEILLQRNTNQIEDNKCIRCNENEIESWEHIWICKDNESNLNEILYESINCFEQQLKNVNQEKDIEVLRNFSIEFLNILENKRRGNINKTIMEIHLQRDQKSNMDSKMRRNQKVKRKVNIKKADLRKKKKENEELLDKDDEKNKKNNKKEKTEDKIEKENKNRLGKNIKIATLTKLTGKITDGINIDNIWDTTVKITNYID
ncbi:hypothetical protein RhiirA1_473237 [Rhizophagus irregularis]|uniref:Uncharacterized protein n=1 Tax=Rhizophagus irregularis TaxID=588596 RepID=A0A2N0R0X4_9GLOM|nr:hypothetical protein RhiirA1_473237 [Rhizophagus irregularis]